MPSEAPTIARWVTCLLDAESTRTAVRPLSVADGEQLTVDEAYAVQDAIVAAKVAAGERVVGAKLGLVSRAKQEAMGIDEPVFGWLTDAMTTSLGDVVDVTMLIHPRVEPEIVFVLGDELAGPGIRASDVLDATAHVCAGLEVLDSRYLDFAFGLGDVVADNTSAARYVIGERRVAPRDVDLPALACVLRRDGSPVAHATGAAVMGDPAAAVAMLANALARRGRVLERGWTILSGGLTAPIPLLPGGRVSAELDDLGVVEIRASR